MPPTTPASVVCWTRSTFRYSWSWWARREMGRVWSQTRPGPARAARKIPSPPKIMLLMPGMRWIWKETLPWKAPTWPG